MKIIISGASGLVGSRLKKLLLDKGDTVLSLVRHPTSSDKEIFWDPANQIIDSTRLEATDCFIHLSGETVAQRWSKAIKKRLVESRVDTTKFLVKIIERLQSPPSLFMCASAIGIYGTHPIGICDEDTASGTGFLAELCKNWEKEADKLNNCNVTVTCLRFGVILSPEGGMLQKLLPIFKRGLGGPIGNGSMNLSWISLEDAVGAIDYLITAKIGGAINITAPFVETNRSFTKKFGHALQRPTFIPVPPLMLRLIYGEMANETILSSTNAMPTKLLNSGFEFLYPTLEDYFQRAYGVRDYGPQI